LQALIEAVPYTIHIVLTDNGIQFGDMPSRRTGPTVRYRLHSCLRHRWFESQLSRRNCQTLGRHVGQTRGHWGIARESGFEGPGITAQIEEIAT